MRKQWVLRSADGALVERVSEQLGLPHLIAQVLVQRGNRSAEEAHNFLCADLGALPNPNQMQDLSKAVALIRKAVTQKHKILIVGDYDVDGLTSAALLYRVIRQMGGQVSLHIPHRLQEGYGLKADVIQRAAKSGIQLLITVDCGTTAFEELTLAKQLGIPTIVADHHELNEGCRPPATAFLNPLQPGCSYPTKELAAAGVAFTLVRGLLDKGFGADFTCNASLWEHLDLVALGTVADMAPLTDENRILVKAGLHALSGTRKAGLRALLGKVNLEEKLLAAEDISFSLAPPLNAMGRMGSAQISLRLLTTEDAKVAEETARHIAQENRNRAATEREAVKKALAKVAREINFNQDRVIVLEDARWHPGVLGIVATRLARRFHRPTVVIASNGSTCRGSARSIPAFHLIEALETLRSHLAAFGGHAAAAGLTIAQEKIPAFREALNRLARERIDPHRLMPLVELDGELPLAGLTEEFMRDLEMLAPFGVGNPRPIFSSLSVRIPKELPPGPFNPFGIRLTVKGEEGHTFEAVQPREVVSAAGNLRRLKGPVKLAYSPVRRPGHTQGCGITLTVKDLKYAT